MASEDESKLGRRIEDPRIRLRELWIDVFLAEQRVGPLLYPNLTSPSYVYSVPNLSGDPGRADLAIITRAFRERPYRMAHSITVGVYLNGHLEEYSSAIDFTDSEGNMDPQVNYTSINEESGDLSTAETLGKFALVTLKSMELGSSGKGR